jgi:hypothetical protein
MSSGTHPTKEDFHMATQNAKLAKHSNVVDLAKVRKARKTPAPQPQPAKPAGPRTAEWHIWWATWALKQFDNSQKSQPRGWKVYELINDWEIQFLKSMRTQKHLATERQVRCLERITMLIERVLQLQEEATDPPAA